MANHNNTIPTFSQSDKDAFQRGDVQMFPVINPDSFPVQQGRYTAPAGSFVEGRTTDIPAPTIHPVPSESQVSTSSLADTLNRVHGYEKNADGLLVQKRKVGKSGIRGAFASWKKR